MDTATVLKPVTYPREICCAHCSSRQLAVDDTWEIYGLFPVCGPCARIRSIPKDRFRCVPCEECQQPTANTLFDARGLFVCGSCYERQRQQSPTQSPGASHAPASATASASPAGAAAGDSRPWYDRPLLTAGLPIGVASLLLIAAAVDRVVDSGAPWHEVGEILSAMAPVLATFGIILALALGWMLRSLSNGLRDARDHGPEADAGIQLKYLDAVDALLDAQLMMKETHQFLGHPTRFDECPTCMKSREQKARWINIKSAMAAFQNRFNLKS